MGRPDGAAVAARAVAAVGEGYSYAQMDCQALVEFCVAQCGGGMAYAGSNDMARNAVTGLWTLVEARALGRLVPGAGLFIREENGAEPARYQADGMGNFSHVGLYVGENALTDTDKTGKSRSCDCVHASASMGRVAGSTLRNGWTHVGWFREIDYGTQETGAAQTDGNTGSDTVAGLTAKASGKAAIASQTVVGAADTSRFYRVRRGCKGGAVRRLQTWLLDLGYDLGAYGADGDFGAVTDAAARAFQQSQGLTADGVVGPKTWAALQAARTAAMRASAADAGTAGQDNAANTTPDADTGGASVADSGIADAIGGTPETDEADTAQG